MNIIVVTHYKNRILCLQEIDGRAERLRLFNDSENMIGNIYIGRVKNVVKNINAAFVEIAPGFICYLNMSETDNFEVLNRKERTSQLKSGDEILVQLIKSAVRDKQPVCTTLLRISRDEYKTIKETALTRTPFYVLRHGNPEFLSFFKKIDFSVVDKVTCEDTELFEAVDGFFANDDMPAKYRQKIALYNDDYSIGKLYKIDTLIEELTSKRVWLRSGANIVIDYAEAMTVIDVNSAKAITKAGDDYIFMTNIEACDEAFRQIRMRSLSGMILIDFINDTDENTLRLTEYITKKAKDEDVSTKFIDMTGLGIAEITRSKKYPTLRSILLSH